MEEMRKLIEKSVINELKLTDSQMMNIRVVSLVNQFVNDRLESIVDSLTYLCEEGKFVELRDEVREILN